uniref:Tafazzin family protein n=1 Tax=Leptocylindrus danicus TaxID=163516 RepID=A0A7S2NY36_9STRA|mmetsp:Transcript_16716/g.24766  ORF Transcript_16716/g.24766 Transcript_16716/m.24766 type:complete len:396 (+) Transcript_16716:132-1319(+)
MTVSRRKLMQYAVHSTKVLLPLTIAGALYHRPLPDLSEGEWGGSPWKERKVTENDERNGRMFSPRCQYTGLGPSPRKSETEGTISSLPSTTLMNLITGLGFRISQMIALNVINFVIHVGMNYYNTFTLLKDDHYDFLIQTIRQETNNPGSNKAVITVSNHNSTIDDPVLFGLLLPWDLKLRPMKIRWTLCSQEICFKNPAIAAMFGAGKVLPIRRQGGIDQPLLLEFARKIAGGDWVHVFPEGKTNQGGTLGANYFGTRSREEAANIGRLKWGVGKLIAHSPKEVICVPFYNTGMEGVVPQKETGEIVYVYPMGGNHVQIRVGGRIYFEDLIAEHESIHGPLKKYTTTPTNGSGNGIHMWKSTEEEKLLYSRITKRIEDQLLDLERITSVYKNKR